MDQLQHFNHVHPLTFKEEEQKNQDGTAAAVGPPVVCTACGDRVHGPSYSCNQCSKFILHKSCAELPREIHHPIHNHPLILLPDRYYSCDICRKSHSGLFSYKCKPCDFDLDLQCASDLSNIKYLKHFSHEHALIFVEDPERRERGLPVVCQGCQEQVLGPAYCCSRYLCHYTLHKSCTEMPLEFRHPRHTQHPLILNTDRAQKYLCDACNQDCSDRFTYSCFQCHFNLDPQCTFNWTGFKHFSHFHRLMFKEGEQKNVDGAAAAGPPVVCTACGDRVLGPSYSCNQCSKFILHKSCAELPREIRHPIHNHPLILVSNRYYYNCDICRNSRSGSFFYKCEPCYFNIDLQCASNLSNIKYLKHFSHEHALIFVEDPERREKGLVVCQGCQEQVLDPAYCCSRYRCHYTLHKSCTEMPLEFRHPRHTQHPLILNTDRAQKYLCDACNQDCSDRFTYSCFQCHFNLDPQCTFNWTGFKHFSHFHRLMFKEGEQKNVDGAAAAGPPVLCTACGDRVLGPSYSCNQCSKFILHKSCAELPREIRHPIHKHPLILFADEYYDSCNICGRDCEELYSYSCLECDFGLDIQCGSNLSNIKYAEHFSHRHILIFREEQEKGDASQPVFCDGCGDQVTGPSYSCRACSYTLHKSCVELPLQMHHPVHTDHPLSLNRDTTREYCCDACNQDCRFRFTYSCFECDFNLDLKCSSDHNAIKHFMHEHALMFKEAQDEEYVGPIVVCDGCQDPVLGPSYTCINSYRRHKCGFNLHKSCAELEREIQHPIHRQHSLSLSNPTENIKVRCLCNACKQTCGFRYNCSVCDFNLDLKCASNWKNIIGNDSHKHQFTVLLRKEMAELHLTCDVCGEYKHWSGTVYYICSVCQLLVHKECASLRRDIKFSGHQQHRLKLIWFLEDTYPKHQFCKVCSTGIDKCRAVYSCHEGCDYVVHIACTMGDYFGKKENSDTDPFDAEIKKKDAEFKHFSHQHKLTAQNSDPRDKDDHRRITCEGCIRPITILTNSFFYFLKRPTNSFYSCKESCCFFFLHPVCAQLPKKLLLRQVHSHKFTLLPRVPSIDGVFQCYMCGTFSQGFAYNCEECTGKNVIYIDLQCIVYWENKALKHDSHVHWLLINTEWDVYCSGCGSNKFFFFSCKRCNFHLCISCVKLPLTAKHRYDDHPLNLTYASDEDELGYYCEICEGKRDLTHWFYRCKDCDFDCHTHCILGRYPQVKLGSTYKHDAHGQHLVTLVDKSKSPIPLDKKDNILPCEKCGKPCEGLVFECEECKISIHREGCCQVTDLESSVKSPN